MPDTRIAIIATSADRYLDLLLSALGSQGLSPVGVLLPSRVARARQLLATFAERLRAGELGEPMRAQCPPHLAYDRANSGRTLLQLGRLRAEVLLVSSPGMQCSLLTRLPGLTTLTAAPSRTLELQGHDLVDWAMLKGQDPGVCVYTLAGSRPDRMLSSKAVLTRPSESYAQLKDRVASEQAQLLAECAAALSNGSLARGTSAGDSGRWLRPTRKAERIQAERRFLERSSPP